MKISREELALILQSYMHMLLSIPSDPDIFIFVISSMIGQEKLYM